jgi:hypothetical protein
VVILVLLSLCLSDRCRGSERRTGTSSPWTGRPLSRTPGEDSAQGVSKWVDRETFVSDSRWGQRTRSIKEGQRTGRPLSRTPGEDSEQGVSKRGRGQVVFISDSRWGQRTRIGIKEGQRTGILWGQGWLVLPSPTFSSIQLPSGGTHAHTLSHMLTIWGLSGKVAFYVVLNTHRGRKRPIHSWLPYIATFTLECDQRHFP